jgi:hypothetical protein
MVGARGVASRLGSKKSGLNVSINGWDQGIHVTASHDNGVDVFSVYSTGGSNHGKPSVLIARIVDGTPLAGEITLKEE